MRLVRSKKESLWYACKAIPKVLKGGLCSRAYLEKLRNEVRRAGLVATHVPARTQRARASTGLRLWLCAQVLCMQQLGVSLDTVYLRDVYEDKANLYLIQDVCGGGSLAQRLDRTASGLGEERTREAVRSILRFLQQCHCKGIVYRDVKPSNFLFLTRDEHSPMKASDLGLAVRWKPGNEKLRGKTGTLLYMAPEVLLKVRDGA